MKQKLIFLLLAAVFLLSLSLTAAAETVVPCGEQWLTGMYAGILKR